MSSYFILSILSILGIAVAGYLVHSRSKRKRPVCVIGERCHVVLESKYNDVFGVKNDVMGILFYATLLGLINFLRHEIGPIDLWLGALQYISLFGAIMAAIFMFVQWRVLKAWCFWCVVSNVNTWVIAFIIFKLF